MYDLDLLYGNLIQVIALPTLKNSFGEVRASLGYTNGIENMVLEMYFLQVKCEIPITGNHKKLILLRSIFNLI